ncbi:NAD(P)-dependent alcohol dehydrogenase [Sinosporangium siamense]|uniref:NADPH:quinone reductase n=1 Tax=Sinosporangium siamense TaxID=1367973 RepID=A0A919RCV5_9ACTN|nr:NAD(P)-dependent alcohol dehydrogenase [Sinosporangium siamense]GII91585.1 NADPH:quinone reductase [Sinosporangium siamense]
MKAYILRSFGPPEALALEDIETPTPSEGEVLVKVRATSVQPYDWHLMRGEPYFARLTGDGPGLRRPKITVLGADVAGQVEAVGPGVVGVRPGDEVYAMPKQGGFGEYACVAVNELAPKPAGLSFEQAAAVPLAALTALLALRDDGRLKAGERVLVNGASGGVGTFAVQLAKAFGAEVTGVCGPRNTGLVRSLGADEVIDYSKEDFTHGGRRFDLFLDIAGSRPVSAGRRMLTRHGRYILIGGPGGRWLSPMGRMIGALATGPLFPQHFAIANVISSTATRQNLLTLTELIENDQVRPVIDRCFPFHEIPAAVAYQEQGHAAGKVVVTV